MQKSEQIWINTIVVLCNYTCPFCVYNTHTQHITSLCLFVCLFFFCLFIKCWTKVTSINCWLVWKMHFSCQCYTHILQVITLNLSLQFFLLFSNVLKMMLHLTLQAFIKLLFSLLQFTHKVPEVNLPTLMFYHPSIIILVNILFNIGVP